MKKQSNTKTGSRWKSRGSYGRMLYKAIKRLADKIDSEEDIEKCLSYAKTMGYLMSIARDFINDEKTEELERRIARLEKDFEQSDTYSEKTRKDWA